MTDDPRLAALEEACRAALTVHHDYIVQIRDGRDSPACTKADALRAALAGGSE